MDDNIKSPIDQLAYLLGSMTARALEAERERDAAKLDAENWYQLYTRKDEQLEEARVALETEIAEHGKTRERAKEMEASFNQEAEAHERTREKLRAYVAKMEEGVAENDADA